MTAKVTDHGGRRRGKGDESGDEPQPSVEVDLDSPGPDEDAGRKRKTSKTPAPDELKAPERVASSGGSRIALQLGKVLKRKREAIQLSPAQVASAAGLDTQVVIGYEAGGRTPYDHALLLARVLGLSPLDLPGIRTPGESPVKSAASGAHAAIAEALRLVYRSGGPAEDRLEGPLDVAKGLSEFVVEVADDSLVEYPRGTLLGFVREAAEVRAGVVLAHHRPSGILCLRRIFDDLLVGLQAELPSYHLDRKTWEIVGRLALVLHP